MTKFDYYLITYLRIKLKKSPIARNSDTLYIKMRQQGHYYVIMNPDDSDGDLRSKIITDHLSKRICLYCENEWKIQDPQKIRRCQKYVRHRQFGCSICDPHRIESTTESPLFKWDDVQSITEINSVIVS